MGGILERIMCIVKNEGITITNLEHMIGASKGVLSRALNNKTDIQAKWLQLIVEKYPLYNSEWLLTGKGTMIKYEQEKIVNNNEVDNYEVDNYEVDNLELFKVLINKNSELSQQLGRLMKENEYLQSKNRELISEIKVFKEQ